MKESYGCHLSVRGIAAKGENTNPFFTKPEVKGFLHSDEITPAYPIVKKVYEYDLQTVPGNSYKVSRRKS